MIAAACALLYDLYVMSRTLSRFSILMTAALFVGFGEGCVIRETNDADYPAADYDDQAGDDAQATAGYDADDLADDDATAVVTFRPVLEPYGMWVDDPTYGLVWVPNRTIVGADFQPYVSGGHWAYTDEGYYWVSDWNWGWAPFHYGRWLYTGGYGWAWIPGARYSPAWVDWRYGGGYVGWAPAAPGWYWRGGVAVTWNASYDPGYYYCPSGSVFSRQPSMVVTPGARQPSLAAQTQPYVPPARVPGGARPFVGPDPRVVGIPPERLAAARFTPPASARPAGISWRPAPNSRVSSQPVGRGEGRYGAPVSRGQAGRYDAPVSRGNEGGYGGVRPSGAPRVPAGGGERGYTPARPPSGPTPVPPIYRPSAPGARPMGAAPRAMPGPSPTYRPKPTSAPAARPRVNRR